MGRVTVGPGFLFPGDGRNRVVDRAGGQCSHPDEAEERGRCRLVSTHVFTRLVNGRRTRRCRRRGGLTVGRVTVGPGFLFPGDGRNRVVDRAGGQCMHPDETEERGRCRLVSTHVYARRVNGRRRMTACCPGHYDALIERYGPDGGEAAP